MSVPVDWGGPLRFERRTVPAVALAVSLTLHLLLMFLGILHTGRSRLIEPRLRARRAEFALMVQGPNQDRSDEKDGKETNAEGPRPAPPPRRIERESIVGPRRAEIDPPEANLARTEHEIQPPRLKHVSVTAVTAARAPGQAGARFEGGVRAARLLHGLGKPRYPAVCSRQGIEGEGEYALAIDETGRVSGVEVLRSAGHPELDKAAKLFFIYKAKFEPATLDGVPIPFDLRQKVAFELE